MRLIRTILKVSELPFRFFKLFFYLWGTRYEPESEPFDFKFAWSIAWGIHFDGLKNYVRLCYLTNAFREGD